MHTRSLSCQMAAPRVVSIWGAAWLAYAGATGATLAAPAGVAFVQADLLQVRVPAGDAPTEALAWAESCAVWPEGGTAEEEHVAARGVRMAPSRKDDARWPPAFEAEVTLSLRLATPALAGRPMHVRCPGAGVDAVVAFDPAAPSPAVQVSQLGFSPHDPDKRAMYSLWAGTLGEATFADAPRFRVMDLDRGRVALKGTATASRATAGESGRIFEMNLAPLTRGGRYCVEVEGVGRSASFRVGEHLTSVPLQLVQRAFTYHRCGVALDARTTDRPRPACHTGGGCFHPGLASTPLYAGEPIDTCRPVEGGWHDASDYGRYVAPASVALFYGMVAYEHQGARLPGWLDELGFELDWLASMVGPGGGVYHKLTSREYGTSQLPQDDRRRLDFAEMTTHDTARCAAVMARAARLWMATDPSRAARYRGVAEENWRFLRAHPSAVPSPGFTNRDWNGGGDYADRFGDADERAWAAAEWMALVGEVSAEMEALVSSPLPPSLAPAAAPLRVHDWPPPFEDAWRFALWTYAQAGHPGRNGSLRKVVHAEWTRRREELVRAARDSAFGLSFTPKPKQGFGFGQMNGMRWAVDLTLARLLVGKNEEGKWAVWSNLGVFFGANPLGLSHMTGFGERAPRVIEYRVDHLDGSAFPLPGHPVDGPASSLHASARKGDGLFVPALEETPPGLRYVEVHDPVLNEPTILEMAETLLVLAVAEDL